MCARTHARALTHTRIHTRAQFINGGEMPQMLDKIYSGYAAYSENHDFVVVEGPGPIMVSCTVTCVCV